MGLHPYVHIKLQSWIGIYALMIPHPYQAIFATQKNKIIFLIMRQVMMQFMSCDRNSKFSILVCCNPISLINPVPAIEVAIFHSCLQSYFTHSSILQSLFQTGSSR